MSPRAPRAIGFDYGGTLVEIGYPAEELVEAGERLLADLGVLEPSGLPRGESFGPLVDRRVDELVASAHRQDPLREVEIFDLYQKVLNGLLGRELSRDEVRQAAYQLQEPWAVAISVDPQALAVLEALRRRGVRLGLLSNAPYPARTMRRMMDGQGITQRFDEIVLSSEIGWRKPAPQAFLALLGALGVPAQDTWFVGDELEADIEGAAAVGMPALLRPGRRPPGSSEIALGSWEELLQRLDREAPPTPA